MDFNMIQTVLKEFIEQNKVVIIKDAPFIYEKDLFAGTKKKLNKNLWVMGEWILRGTTDDLTATVQKRFGNAGSEWEAEVFDAFQEQCLNWICNYTTTGKWLISIKFS
jgi:hypothetical protein